MGKTGLHLLGSSILPKVQDLGHWLLECGLTGREWASREAANFLVIPTENWLQMHLFFFPAEEELAMLFLLVYGSGRCLAPVTSEGWGLLIGLWQVQCHPKMLWTRITLDFVFKVFTQNILDIEAKDKHEICSFLMHFIHTAWRWFYLIFLVCLYVNHNLQYELRCRIFHLWCLTSAQKVSETRFQIGDDWLELNCLDIWDRILGGSISGEMGKRHWGCGVPGGASSVVDLQCAGPSVWCAFGVIDLQRGRPSVWWVCWTFNVVYIQCDRPLVPAIFPKYPLGLEDAIL